MKTIVEWKDAFKPGMHVKQIFPDEKDITIIEIHPDLIRVFNPEYGYGWLQIPEEAEIEFTRTGWISLQECQRVAEYEWIE